MNYFRHISNQIGKKASDLTIGNVEIYCEDVRLIKEHT